MNDWHNAGVESIGQVKQLDEEYAKRATNKKTAAKKENSTVPPDGNYEKRSYNKDYLEAVISKKLEE